MRKLMMAATLTLAGLPGTSVSAAAVLGPDAAVCEHQAAPAMLVRVLGLKSRTGFIRVQSYGGNPASFFDKGTYLRRVELPVPTVGPVDVCVPVAHPGTYAVSVRHDADGNRQLNRSDGGGVSGNPHVSMMDVLLHRKPDPKVVGVPVRAGVTTVPVVLNYADGFSFGPIASHGS